jgi:beta-galactosidase
MILLSRRTFLRQTFLNAAAFCTAAGLRLPSWARTFGLTESSTEESILFGVDYYPDQTPENLWEEDARMISAAGLTNVRIAEFAWALMEPSEGKFDFAWLRRAIDILHRNNIAVILGTPSAAPPPWLSARYPEIFEVNAQGQKLHPGGRRFTCPTNKTYRRLSLAIATQMAQTFAQTPGIIGWQIDNEFTLSTSGRCYCEYCQVGFQDWVRAKYRDLDTVNRTWGTAFWSQIYTDFSQIPVPLLSGGDPNPGLALDYDRYQSYANASFQQEQLAMLRRTCPNHFITTNNVGLVDTIDMRELYASLDFVAFDNYPGFFEMHLHQRTNSKTVPPEMVATPIAFSHDMGRSIKNGKPFLIMEEQSGKAGQPTFSPQPEPGQVRLWTYQAVAHGAMGVNYFRWDTATFGAEEYWHGMLNHDRSKSPAFDEIVQTVKELKSLGPALLHSSYPAETALMFDYDCSWAFQIQPCHYALRYMDQVTAWYGAISPSHTGIDIVAPTSDLSKYKIVFAPAPYVISEKQAENIRSFVRNGGLFVAGFRLGAKNEFSQIVRTPLPGLLRDVMGVTVADYVPLYSGNQGVKFDSTGILAGDDAECALWADILQPETAQVLATYTAGAYASRAAITINRFGKGEAVYLGADLTGPGLSRVLQILAARTGVKLILTALGLEITLRQSSQDVSQNNRRQWLFILNHTAEPKSVDLPANFTDALSGATRSGKLTLKPYDVAVLRPA